VNIFGKNIIVLHDLIIYDEPRTSPNTKEYNKTWLYCNVWKAINNSLHRYIRAHDCVDANGL